MGYFKNLFPELQQDTTPTEERRKAAMPGGYVEKQDTTQAPTNHEELWAGHGPKSRQQDQPPTSGPNVKAEYQRAQQAKSKGLNEALKILTEVDADEDKRQKTLSAGPMDPLDPPDLQGQDRDQLIGVIERLGKKSEHPSKLADDLRFIASKPTVGSLAGQKILKAADMLEQAAKADEYLNSLKQPGGALHAGPQDVQRSADVLEQRLTQQQAGLQGAGALRTAAAAPEAQRQQQMLARLRKEQGAGAAAATGPDAPDLKSVMTASGWGMGDFFKRAIAMSKQMGFDMSAQIAPGAAGYAIANMISAMGPAGQMLLAQMKKDVQGPQDRAMGGGGEPGSGKAPPRAEGDFPDPYEARLRDREMRFDQAYQELKNLPAFNSMFSVMFYVLFAVMIGPGPAAALFTNKGRKGQLEQELGFLENEMRRLMQAQDNRARMREQARTRAAMESMRERQFAHQVRKDEFYMQLRQESPAGKDAVLDNLIGGYRLWQDELDEAEKVLNNQFDFSEAEIKSARAKREKALPMVTASRQNIMRYRAQKLGEAQGGSE